MTSERRGVDRGDSHGAGWSAAFDKVQPRSRKIVKEDIA
jgi:hypothetical protein